MLSLLILLLGTEVFSRFLLSKSFSWIEELCRYLFVWASYLGVAIAVKRKEQLRVLMLMDTLEKHFPRLVKVCYVVSELSFAVFCVLVFYYSINMLENMTRFKQVSASLEINVMYAYLIIPLVLCTVMTAYVWFLGDVLITMRKNKMNLIGYAISFAVILATMYPMIHAFGMNGASFAIMVAYGAAIVFFLVVMIGSVRKEHA